MRLTLDLDTEIHRKIKTLAAFHGQTVKAFILSRIGLEESDPPQSSPEDETAYLFSTRANAEHLEKGLQGKPENRLKFDSIEDVKRALGI
ncbi:MAG: hypothetical protein V4726_06860 [Verrucomicrobiota bacterium]